MSSFDSFFKYATGHGSFEGKGDVDKLNGVYIGVVTNNKHPDGEYMVKVKLKQFYDEEESWWCRIASSLAGGGRGFYNLPEVEDEVLVSFLNGDPNQGVLLGMMWNGKDKFPQELKTTPDDKALKIPNSEQGGKNNYRFFHSRNNHVLMFSDEEGKLHVSLRSSAGNELVLDDTSGKEKIQLYDKDNKQWMEISVPDKTITLQTDTGDIVLKAKKKILLECEDYVLKASKTIKAESGTSTEHKAGSTAKIESGSTMDIKAGGVMTQQAPTIKLN